MQTSYDTRSPATPETNQARRFSFTGHDEEGRLSRGESVLLLGAFATLAVSMASFMTL
jgi:hypothetical protein